MWLLDSLLTVHRAVADVSKATLEFCPVWQLLSAVVRHFTHGMAPVTMGAKTKTPAEAWGSTSGEVRHGCAAVLSAMPLQAQRLPQGAC